MSRAIKRYQDDVTQLFEKCVKIQNIARSLTPIAMSIEMLAKNGVVQAARITGSEGRPLVTLAEILSALPNKIVPEVEALESACRDLAETTANCAHLVRRFSMYGTSLKYVVERANNGAATTAMGAEDVGEPDNDDEEEKELTINELAEHPALASISEIEDINVKRLLQSSIDAISQLKNLIGEANLIVEQNGTRVNRIRNTGFTAHYVALNVRIEAARISQWRENFQNLATTVKNTVDDLDGRLESIETLIQESTRLMRTFSGRGLLG
jgi:hypothetical protein